MERDQLQVMQRKFRREVRESSALEQRHLEEYDLLGLDDPMEPPGGLVAPTAWESLQALENSYIPLAVEGFRDRPLYSHSRNVEIRGDHDRVVSVLNGARDSVFDGRLRNASGNGPGAEGFMREAERCFAVCPELRAGSMEGGTKAVVADTVEVGKANGSTDFLVSGEADVTFYSSEGRHAGNISRYRGDWDELQHFFRNDVPEGKKRALAEKGFERRHYTSLSQLRSELDRVEPVSRGGEKGEEVPEHARESFQSPDPDAYLPALEKVMDARAYLASQTVENDLQQGNVETHLEQAGNMLDGDLLDAAAELSYDSPTREAVCGRYVDSVARYARARRALE